MRTLARLLAEACRARGSSTFLVYPDGPDDALHEESYADFLEAVRTWADFLRCQGVQPGDRVGIITPKSARQVRRR